MLTARLALMMFLEFFIWGAYFVSMALYVGEAAAPQVEAGTMSADEVSGLTANAYTAIPIGAIVAPLLLGLVADRVLPAQVVLGLLHLIGAGLLYALTVVPLDQFVWVLIAYAICYMPTLGLTNTVAFHAITESGAESKSVFPIVRVLGTIGWIAAGLLVGFGGFGTTATQFTIAAAASVVLGLYSFSLPSTPPAMRGKRMSVGSLLGVDALKLMSRPSFAIFMIASMALCIPLAAYYQQVAPYLSAAANVAADVQPGEVLSEDALAERTVLARATATATLGQVSEIGFMLLIPFFFRRLGTKWMLLIGMLAWTLRYVLFALSIDEGIVPLILLGVVLHGICYDFFFVVGQIYVDEASPPEVRGQAQGLLVLMTQGIGMIIGAQLTGWWAGKQQITQPEAADWETFWYAPAAMALAIAVCFAIGFREPPAEPHDGGDDGDVAADPGIPGDGPGDQTEEDLSPGPVA